MLKNQLQTLALPEWGQLAEEAVRRMPRLSSIALQAALFVLAPHQRRVGLQLTTWDKRHCEGRMKIRRRMAGWGRKAGTSDFAAAGELVASLVLVRNVNVLTHTMHLKELNVVSDRTPEKSVRVSCTLDPQSFSKIRMVLTEKGEAMVSLKSDILNDNDQSVAQIRSVWNIKKRK